MIEELKDIHTLPERFKDEDEQWWLDKCIHWYRDKDSTLRCLIRYLEMHPDSKWITEEEKQRLRELHANQTLAKLSDAYHDQYVQLMRSRVRSRMQNDISP